LAQILKPHDVAGVGCIRRLLALYPGPGERGLRFTTVHVDVLAHHLAAGIDRHDIEHLDLGRERHGRVALRQRCIDTFEKFDFSFEMGRRLYGDDHWVFEWTMVLALKEPGGAPFTAKVEMLDVVTVNSRGEVARKDVYMNGGEAQAAFARAGIKR
jgi:hypothetical protein